MDNSVIQSIFERKEIKYIITREQKEALLSRLEGRMQADQYGCTTICNIYFDTPTHRVIRESIEKPKYKEKLRLRTYGVPTEDGLAFVELKKKLNGVVYKRRETMRYVDAMRMLVNRENPVRPSQIVKEIEWLLERYPDLRPAMVLCYDRTAYFGCEDPELRLTIDTNIRFRTHDFDLMLGPYGQVLLDENSYILELKITDAVPLWLSHIFDELRIYPGSYTKYGNAYKKLLIDGGMI
ncbi:MAG: polyphosphate polymerase domain-containing protein [Clostridia bacterium]|nr:polyphosphate polymerase domain-containing protein [Clostridia bacterium]